MKRNVVRIINPGTDHAVRHLISTGRVETEEEAQDIADRSPFIPNSIFVLESAGDEDTIELITR